LLDDELERRSQQHLLRSLALSGCDGLKTLALFDFLASPGINRTLIQDLATCAFIPRHENILLCGPTGVGKSHLANAIAIEALKRDYRVLSRPTHRLLNDLHTARASGTHFRLFARILRCDLLVWMISVYRLSAQAVQDLYEILPSAMALFAHHHQQPLSMSGLKS
jgi:DNA replication protein DnaC